MLALAVALVLGPCVGHVPSALPYTEYPLHEIEKCLGFMSLWIVFTEIIKFLQSYPRKIVPDMSFY